jgi:hypothetical protein
MYGICAGQIHAPDGGALTVVRRPVPINMNEMKGRPAFKNLLATKGLEDMVIQFCEGFPKKCTFDVPKKCTNLI